MNSKPGRRKTNVHYRELENCILFQNIPADEIETLLNTVPHRVKELYRGEIVFRLMEPALQIGILLSGKVEVQKTFERGSRINVSVRGPGELIGPAAAFSDQKRYPCDIIALEPTSILMFHNQDLLQLLQRDIRILESFTAQIASATYMLQQRLELFSYSGIAQKVAFYLLMQMRQSGKCTVRIPETISGWALLMNVSRPSLHRELRHLSDQGILSCKPPAATIFKPEALEEILSR